MSIVSVYALKANHYTVESRLELEELACIMNPNTDKSKEIVGGMKIAKQAYKVEIILCCFLLLTATINVNASEGTYVSDSGEQFEYVVEDGYARLTLYWVLPGRIYTGRNSCAKRIGRISPERNRIGCL